MQRRQEVTHGAEELRLPDENAQPLRRDPAGRTATRVPASRTRSLEAPGRDPNARPGKRGAVPTSLHTRGETRRPGTPNPQGLGGTAPDPSLGSEGTRRGSERQTRWEGEHPIRQGVGGLLAGHGAKQPGLQRVGRVGRACVPWDTAGDPRPAASFCTGVFSVSKRS